MSYPGFIAQDFLGPDFGSSQMGQFGFTVGGISYAFVANPAAIGGGCEIVVYKSTDLGQTWAGVGTGPTIPILVGSGTPVWTVARDGSNVIALWAELQMNALGAPWTVAHIGKAVFSLTGEAWGGQTTIGNPGLDMYQYAPFADTADRGVSLTLLQLIVRGPGNYVLFYQGTCNVLGGTPVPERQARVSYSTFNGSTFGPEIQIPGQGASYFYGICGGCADTNGLITFLYTRKGWGTLGPGRNRVFSCSLSAANAFGTPVEITQIYIDDFKGRMTVPTPVAYTTGGVAHVAFAAWTWVSGFTTELRSFDSLSVANPTWANTLVTSDQSLQPVLPHHFYAYPYILSAMSDGATLALAWTNTDVITDSAVAFYYSTTPVSGAFAWTTPALLWNAPILDGSPSEATQVGVYLATGGFIVLGVSTSVESDVSVRVESYFIPSGSSPSPPGVTCGSPPSGKVGTTYSHTFPASGGTPPYVFTITTGTLPPGLLLTSSSGNVSGTPTLAGNYLITVTVTDANSLSGTANCSLHIDPALGIGCNDPPDGALGDAYSHPLTISGAPAGSTVSTTGGALPPGLTIDSAGLISGTPTLAGPYSFTATVTTLSSETASVTCSMNVGYGDLSTSCGAPPAYTVGMPGAVYRPPVVMGYISLPPVYDLNHTLVWTFPVVPPPGFHWETNPASDNYGYLVGTPTVSGVQNFTYTVSTPDGQSITNTCPLDVAPADDGGGGGGGGGGGIEITCANPPGGKVGVPYSHTFPVTGATGPTRYSVVVGALPPGVTLDPATGDLSGTPTAPGTYSFSIKVQQ